VYLILVIIGLLVCLLLYILTIYFKSIEGSPQKLVSGNLVVIILFPLIFLLFKLITKSIVISIEIEFPAICLGVYFFIIGILFYFFKMAEMASGFQCLHPTMALEQKEIISKKLGLFSISLGFYLLMIVVLKYFFSEIGFGLLMVGGILFSVAKLLNARFSMLIGIFFIIVGIFRNMIQIEGVFAELAFVFSVLIGVYVLLFEVVTKKM